MPGERRPPSWCNGLRNVRRGTTMQKRDEAPDPQAAELAERLRQAVGAFVRAVRTEAEAGRSAQAETLGLLDRGGPQNVAALAQARGVTHQTMRLIAAQLEAAALVRSDPDPADRRSRLLSLSDAGRAELARGRQARASRIEDLIRTGLSPAERDILSASVALLERMSASAGRR